MEQIGLSAFRSGTYVNQGSYKAFLPEQVNKPWWVDSPQLSAQLSTADRLMGELKALAQLVHDVSLFIAMHTKKEAIASARIEGTKTNIDEAVLPIEEVAPNRREDWLEVNNYVSAMDYAKGRLLELPLSNRLLRETHVVLLREVRGQHKMPGEFRTSQNWIGGASIMDAQFVPPPPHEVQALMADLEQFMHAEDNLPPLIRIGIAHYQFETIHPFLDGNGRLGRLLITLYLLREGVLPQPLLYLSDFFEQHRQLYYDNLMLVRHTHNITQWLLFFLSGVIETAQKSITTLRTIKRLQEKWTKKIDELGLRFAKSQQLLIYLFAQPIVSAKMVQEQLNTTAPTANRLLNMFKSLGIVDEITEGGRNRKYRFTAYMQAFENQKAG